MTCPRCGAGALLIDDLGDVVHADTDELVPMLECTACAHRWTETR